MRMKQAMFVGGLLVVGLFGLPIVARAQSVEVAQPLQVIGPLYAYGPAPALAEPRYAPQPPVRARCWNGAGRSYGYGAYRPYQNYAYGTTPYRPRYRDIYWYGRPYVGQYERRPQYAARILTPRWYGARQQAIGSGYLRP